MTLYPRPVWPADGSLLPGFVWTPRGRVMCTSCARTGWYGGSWVASCLHGHAPCPACGRQLAVKLDGTPRVHTRCPATVAPMTSSTPDTTGRHPGTVQLLRHFEHAHLPEHLAAVSAPFGRLADELVAQLPDSAELTTALRKLLEAKDCAVRAKLDTTR